MSLYAASILGSSDEDWAWMQDRRKDDRSVNARDLIHLAERIYLITMPTTGHGSDRYRIHDEETFVEQLAQHPSFKGCDGPHASGTYILTFEADTPETEQLAWIAQILSGTNLDDGFERLIKLLHTPSQAVEEPRSS